MVHVGQIVLNLLAASGSKPQTNKASTGHLNSASTKSIAVVGAGSAGLAALDTLLQYKDKHHANWAITLFEQRHDVGGIWLPNDHRSTPPELPMTPLYPRLKTITPVPAMTYPGPANTFPEGTPLYPSFRLIEEYHQGYARRQGLYPFIRFNHTVTATQWMGNSTAGQWVVAYNTMNATNYGHFDHLVVAAGAARFPNNPSWPGQESWLAHKKHREMIHSTYFHVAEEYKGAKILVVGSGRSATDIARQLAYFCEVHMSVRHEPVARMDSRITIRADISHFTRDAIVFSDNTTYEPDVVMLCTGYELRFPFLEANGTLSVDPGSSQPSERLKTNLRYVYPLHNHIFSLDPSYPVTALSFIGLRIHTPPRAGSTAQGTYLAHSIADPSILDSRQVMLQQLADQEENMRKQGHNPYNTGHRIFDLRSLFDYQEDLIDYLKLKGALPQDGRKFVEEWRREVHGKMPLLQRAWQRVERLGTESEWLTGVSTESEWVSMMKRLDVWEREQERLEGGS